MNNPIIRSLYAVILGIVVAFVMFMLIEGISAVLHPFPENFSGTQEEIMAQVENYPTWVLALLGGGGWSASMFLCVFAATRTGANRHPWHGIAVGVFWFGMLAFNMYILPYPTWYLVLNLIMLPVMAFAGIRVGMKSQSSSEGLAEIR